MEPDADLVRPYVARMGGDTVEAVTPAAVWGDATSGPKPDGDGAVAPSHRAGAPGPSRSGRRSRRNRRSLLIAGALLMSAAAAVILAVTLGGSPSPGAAASQLSAPPLAPTTVATPPTPSAPPHTATASHSPDAPTATGAGAAAGARTTAPQASASGAASDESTASADGTLRPGDSGPAVVRLQQLLFGQGFTYVQVTGVYDEATTRGVTQLQQDRDLTGDPPGVYGPVTRASLEGTG